MNEKLENWSKKINFLHNFVGQKRESLKVFSQSFSSDFNKNNFLLDFITAEKYLEIHQTSAPDISTMKIEINLVEWLDLIFVYFIFD